MVFAKTPTKGYPSSGVVGLDTSGHDWIGQLRSAGDEVNGGGAMAGQRELTWRHWLRGYGAQFFERKSPGDRGESRELTGTERSERGSMEAAWRSARQLAMEVVSARWLCAHVGMKILLHGGIGRQRRFGRLFKRHDALGGMAQARGGGRLMAMARSCSRRTRRGEGDAPDRRAWHING